MSVVDPISADQERNHRKDEHLDTSEQENEAVHGQNEDGNELDSANHRQVPFRKEGGQY